MPRKSKRSKRGPSRGISNLMPHASPQGHSISREPPLPPLDSAQPFAPTITQIPSTILTAQNLASLSDPQFHEMSPKTRRSNKKGHNVTSTLTSHASSQLHSEPVEPSLQHSKATQPRAPMITIIPPSIPTAQNVVSSSNPPSHTFPRKIKVKHSEKTAAFGISNSTPHASSQGLAQPSAPTGTLVPPSIPEVHDPAQLSDPPSLTKPCKAKYSNKRVCHGISNLMPYASSQGHSTLVVPKPSTTEQPCVPAITFNPLPIPTTQNLVSPSDAPSSMPRKPKLSRERKSLGISNFMPQASSQRHSRNVETLQPYYKSSYPSTALIPPSNPAAQDVVSPSDPPLPAKPSRGKRSRERASLGRSKLMPDVSSHGHSTHVAESLPQPSQVAQSYAPATTLVPSSIPTSQNLTSSSDPPLHAKPRRGKFSRERASLGISNLIPDVSSHGRSTHVAEPLLQPSQVAQSYAPTTTTPLVPSSIPAAQNLVSPLDPSLNGPIQNIFSGILNLMHHAFNQGHSIPGESSHEPLKPLQPCAPTITNIPTSIPAAEDLISPSDLPSCLRRRKSKRSKKRKSHGISNVKPHASNEGHSIPMEPPQQSLELEKPRAPPVIPPSIPTAQGLVSASPSNLSPDQVSGSPSDPSQDRVFGSPSDPSQDQVSGSPSDSSQYPILGSPSDPSFVLPSTRTLLATKVRPHTGRQWTVQAIDEHGSTKRIQVTKPGVFMMPPGQRIVVPFDRQLRAFGEAATLLSSACGRIATDSKNIPINFDSWPKVPKSYKDDCFNILKTLFQFQASESIAKRYCLLTLSRKYRNGKLDLWTRAFDPSLSREQLIAKVPDGIEKDQWLSFVDNHLKPEYLELCRKNAELRRKQTTPHTGGSKLLSRKQHEMEEELGRTVGRVELFVATHTKKDGSYVNEEAKSIVEKLAQEISKCAKSSEISIDDALGKVLGHDHSGRVRCLGLGGLHSVAFQSNSAGFSGIGSKLLADAAESSQLKEEVSSLKSKLAASDETVKTLQSIMLAYIQMKEGRIPAELGALIETPKKVDEPGENDMSSGSSSASNDGRSDTLS